MRLIPDGVRERNCLRVILTCSSNHYEHFTRVMVNIFRRRETDYNVKFKLGVFQIMLEN